jgi:hypothetical protein
MKAGTWSEVETVSVRIPARSRVEEGRGGLARLASLRFPSPLIEPDLRISRIRLSDWLHLKAHGVVQGAR